MKTVAAHLDLAKWLPARHTIVSAALALALWIALSASAWACPGCKDALSAQEGGGDLVSGYFWSICFMMSMPFVILGTFGTAMYLAVRRARAEQAAQAAAAPPDDELVEV